VHSLRRNGGPPVAGKRLLVRAVAVTCAALIAAGGLVAVGRWEERRAARKELAGMQTVLAQVGNRIDSPQLSGFRYGSPDCLAYHGADMLLEYQLCFDPQGRLVEAVDRRPLQPKYYSLEYKPALSTIRFPRTQVDSLLRRTATAAGY
jgi:hypothetical protein